MLTIIKLSLVAQKLLKDTYPGERLTVVHCRGALDSFEKAINCLPAKQQGKFARRMNIQLTRLAKVGRLSGEHFPKEGTLPNSKNFNALKFIPIRGYCWYSSSRKAHCFVSHYIEKDFGKLRDKDTKKVRDNWNRIEVKNENI